MDEKLKMECLWRIEDNGGISAEVLSERDVSLFDSLVSDGLAVKR